MKRKIIRYRLLLLYKIHTFLCNMSYRVANRYKNLYASLVWEEYEHSNQENKAI